MQLPRGVALVMLVERDTRVVLVSDSLTHDQELAARVLAAVYALDGRPYVKLSCLEVMGVLHAAAA